VTAQAFPALYAILDVDAIAVRGWTPVDVCRAWLAAGVRLVQLRAKALSSGPFLELADQLSGLCREAGARLIINDRADVAALTAAHGVHVGQDDLTPTEVRRVVGPDAMVGLSTHTLAQLGEGVLLPISYVAIGPVFTTATKDTGYEAIGLARVGEAALVAARAGLPLVAIGGLSRERAAAVRDAGADSLAVISDLLPGALAEVESRARAWLRASRARL